MAAVDDGDGIYMLSWFSGAWLYLSSYMPLFAILSLENAGAHNIVAALFILLAIFGLAGAAIVPSVGRRNASSIPDTVIRCEERGDELMGYISAYLIPFLGFDLSNWRYGVALALFLSYLGYLYVTTSMIYVNPLLRLLGYRVYAVDLERCGSIKFISKRALAPNDIVEVVSLVDRVAIEGTHP